MIQQLESTHLMPSRRHADRIHAFQAPKSSLIRFVDAIDAPVILVSREGRLTVMNGPARDFFLGRVGQELRESIEAAARNVIRDRSREGVPNRAHRIQAGGAEFVATFVTAGPDIATQDIGAMVLLRRESPGVQAATLGETALAKHFGLTAQETRVALLLAEHRSNRDIANQLGVSVHTARHHTERVLAKLHIHSRYDVRRVLS